MPAPMIGRDPDGNFREVAVDLDGNLGVAAGAGSATSDLQEDQLAALADILTEVTGAAKDTSVAAVTAAVTALGAGATIAQLLAELGLHGDVLDTVVARLDVAMSTRASEATASAIKDGVDDLEPDADATRIAVQSIDSKTPALESGRTPTNSRLYVGPTVASTTQPVPTVRAPAVDGIPYSSFGSPIDLTQSAGYRVRGFLARGGGTITVKVAKGNTSRTYTVAGSENRDIEITEITSVSGVTSVEVYVEAVPT